MSHCVCVQFGSRQYLYSIVLHVFSYFSVQYVHINFIMSPPGLDGSITLQCNLLLLSLLSFLPSSVAEWNIPLLRSGLLGSIQNELELINSIPIKFRNWSGNWN